MQNKTEKFYYPISSSYHIFYINESHVRHLSESISLCQTMRICTFIFFSALTLDKAFLTLGKPATKNGDLTKALIHDKIAEVKDKSENSLSSNKDNGVDPTSKLTAKKRYVHTSVLVVETCLFLTYHSTLNFIFKP